MIKSLLTALAITGLLALLLGHAEGDRDGFLSKQALVVGQAKILSKMAK